ncbi:hypothetical protein [Saccharicrinis sp. 156]|uniref:hypothetical protein n=1 Tax=Saccharicrinis sp. 156 TaxID=3417574 RepID=UPI003D355A77
MNYIRHQQNVFAMMDANEKLKPNHVSMYISLFRIWNWNRFENPITIYRKEVMKMSKINSTTTYAKVLKDLELHGFIRYHPSFDPNQGSKVHLSIFDTGTCPPPVQNLVPLYKHIKHIHSIYSNEEVQNQSKTTDMNEKKKKAFQKPPIEHIQIYFEQKGHPSTEAERFFNYYESNGWMVGGKSKMKDWKAAARNWMLNVPKFQASPPKTTKAQTTEEKESPHKTFSGKNYSEPL